MGINHQVSRQIKPKLTGTAERFNCTLMEMASSMLSFPSLGHIFWDYAVQYALVMMTKTKYNAEGINAWFNLTGCMPNLAKSFMFGKFIYVQIPLQTHMKARLNFDKGELARVLGHEEGMSGWSICFERTGQFMVSRDVKKANDMLMSLQPVQTSSPSYYGTIGIRLTVRRYDYVVQSKLVQLKSEISQFCSLYIHHRTIRSPLYNWDGDTSLVPSAPLPNICLGVAIA